MSNETSTPTLWVRVYTPDGYQAALTLPITSVADALAHFDAIRAAGLTATLPVAGGLESGEKSDTITTVVRREKENKHGNMVSVIDCYWEGAKHAFTAIYLDEPEQITEFERQSGLKVRDLPLYESDAPKQLDPAKPSKYERKCNPFIAIKTENGMKNVGGKDQMTYKFVRYGTLAGAPQTAPTQPEPSAPAAKQSPPPTGSSGFTRESATAFTQHWFKTNMLSVGDILTALGIEAFGEWKLTEAEAHARVAMWLQVNRKGADAPAAAPLAANARHRP